MVDFRVQNIHKKSRLLKNLVFNGECFMRNCLLHSNRLIHTFQIFFDTVYFFFAFRSVVLQLFVSILSTI